MQQGVGAEIRRIGLLRERDRLAAEPVRALDVAEPHEGAGTSRPPPHERRGIGCPRLRDVREGHRFLDALFGREHEVRPRRGDARAKPVVSRVRGGGEGALDRGLGGVELAGEPADHAGPMQGNGEIRVRDQPLDRGDRARDQLTRLVEASSPREEHGEHAREVLVREGMSRGVRLQSLAPGDRALDGHRSVEQCPSNPSERERRFDRMVRSNRSIGCLAQIVDHGRRMTTCRVHLPTECSRACQAPAILELGEPLVRLVGDPSRGVQGASVGRRTERRPQDPHVVIDRIVRDAYGRRQRRVDRRLGFPHAPGLDLMRCGAEHQLCMERVVLLQDAGGPSLQGRGARRVADLEGMQGRTGQEVDRVGPIRTVRRRVCAESDGGGQMRPGRAGMPPAARTSLVQFGSGEAGVGSGGVGRWNAGRGDVTGQRVGERDRRVVGREDALLHELGEMPLDVSR